MMLILNIRFKIRNDIYILLRVYLFILLLLHYERHIHLTICHFYILFIIIFL